MAMRTVYLDQNKWIDLGRAYHDRPGGEPYKEALDVLRYGVEHGLVSVPLSSTHYMETQKRRDQASRHRLVQVMAVISRFDAIAPPSAIVPAEIESVLREWYGKPSMPRPPQPFGKGVSHAFDSPDLTYTPPQELTPWQQTQAREFAVPLMEFAALMGPQDGSTIPSIRELPDIGEYERRYAEGEEDRARLVAENEEIRGTLSEFVIASEIGDILDVLNDCFARGGITRGESDELDSAEGVTQLLMSLPSRRTVYHLRQQQHENPETIWRPSDLLDLSALSVAVPYCDVVVTEGRWVHHLKRANINDAFNTTLLHDLDDLAATVLT